MRKSILFLATLLIAGCTEKLVTPGTCPSLCPGGIPSVRDTVLTALPWGDSSFTRYASVNSVTQLLVANGGELGNVNALIRFIPRGDSVFAGDSLKPFTIDSVVLSVVLQSRDTLVSGMALDVYRLPASFDTLTTYAEMQEAMTPDRLLGTFPVPDAARTGRLLMLFTGDELQKLEFTPADSTRLVLGIRLRSNTPGGLYLGALLGGDVTPLYQTFTKVDIADTALQHPMLQRGVQQNVSIAEHGTVRYPDLLTVGGTDGARALIRFPFPDYLRDSATIIRATLELVPDQPVYGIAGDSARIEARSVVGDFGAKSVVNNSNVSSAWIRAGSDTTRIEIANLVAMWQASTNSPHAVRVQLGPEYATFLTPHFRSTRSEQGGPRLRITYRTPYGTTGF
jgi:hypothetical protein